MLFRECFQHLNRIERKRIVMPKYTMRLNRGERPEPLPEELRRRIQNALSAKKLQRYPSYSEFYQQLSTHFQVPEKNICVGAGIEEFIRTLTFLCCDPGQKMVVLPWPSCAMFDIYAKAFNVNIRKVSPGAGFQPTINDVLYMLEQGTWDYRLVFVVNPGQPVETCYDVEDLEKLATACKQHDVVLAIDEAHHGFGAPTAMPLIKYHDNVVVLRTFSKFYGAASIRVGMAFGSERVIQPLHAVRPSGEIAGYSMTIAGKLLEEQDMLDMLAVETANARDYTRIFVNTQDLGIKAYGRFGFSILIEFPTEHEAHAVADGLNKRGILVKSHFPPPINKCMLLACGSQYLMKQFCSELLVEVNKVRNREDLVCR